jgi:arabinogalactan endo-1,4-beta-galactosidase
VNPLDYDIIGVSYYPIWHGKSLNDLRFRLTELSNNFGKEILIAETAYPFTLSWNDWTNNIVGLEEQLILPDYPATPSGQQNFVRDLKNLVLEIDNGIGFCYWGAELIAWDGENSENGSVWENQALFDFDNTELPVLQEFNLN